MYPVYFNSLKNLPLFHRSKKQHIGQVCYPIRGKINAYVFVVLTQLFEDIRTGGGETKVQ